jgi:hypothetical protein
MTKNEFATDSTCFTTAATSNNKKIAVEEQQRRSIYDNNVDNDNEKSRKFRWSSCFSFITTKFKKSSKSSRQQQQKIRTSQSYEDFDRKDAHLVPTSVLSETIEGKNL